MKGPMGLERLMQEPRLQVRELLPRGMKEVDHLPFACKVTGSDIGINIPFYARISVKEGLRWTDIHNGQRWNGLGVRPPQPEMTFQLPLQSEWRIQLQGRTWLLRQRPVTLEPIPFNLRQTIKRSRFFGFSLFGHLSLFAMLWGIIHLQFGGLSPDEAQKAELAKKTPPKVEDSGAAGGGAPSRPFEGISYTEYLRRVEQAKREANPLGYLAQSLNKMKANYGAGNAKTAGAQSATGNIGKGMGSGVGPGLTAVVSNQKFQMQNSAGESTKLNDSQKLALRQKLREMEGDFRRIYNRLLSQDPTLAVTVAIETTVKPTGYLELSAFKPRGTYKPEIIAQLKSAMAEVVRSVYAGTEFSGITLKAEEVFVR